MKAVYRNNIILRMGGEAGFDFLVATYCENIQDDERLNRFFGNFDLKTLISLQKEFLLVSFLEPYEETEPRKKRVMFRNDMMGIDGSIFPLLEQNFVAALEDCCIGGLDFELCKAYFSQLHALFKECSNDYPKYRENIVELMGGESVFEFLVLSFCERLEEDERLICYFEDFDSRDMILLQKELILMAFLHPKNASNDFGALRQRLTSAFSPLFELGMNEAHFAMMESHFSTAVCECLSGPVEIQCCLRLFANLVTFFQDNLILSNRGYDGEDDEESIWSETLFDEEEDSLCSFSFSKNDDTCLYPIPSPEEASSHVTKPMEDARSQESSQSVSYSDNTMPLHSSETKSQDKKRGSILLDSPCRPDHSITIHSRRRHKKKERGASYVSKRIQAVLDRSPKDFMESERTEDTLSMRSEDSKPVIQPAPSAPDFSSMLSTKGRPKFSFSWKKPSFRRNTKTATMQ